MAQEKVISTGQNEDLAVLEEQSDNEEEPWIEYDITTYPSDYTLSVLYQMWQKKDITIPDYQREFVWSIAQSSLLIESFLIGLPVPPVFFYIDDVNNNLVIDGQQRLMSIFYYFEGYFGRENESGKRQVFKLTGLDDKNPFSKKRFEDLDIKDKRKLENSVLRVINVRQLAPNDNSTSVYHIFERLNTGGTPLKPQEIRNCVYRGQFLDTLRELNTNAHWRNIIGKKLPDKRQSDVELLLRVFALCYYKDEYEKPMKEFLNKSVKKNQDGESYDFRVFVERFPIAVEQIDKELRKKPFSVRGPLNPSIMDSVLCCIINNLDSLPEDIGERFEALIADEKYNEYTSSATTDSKIVKERLKYAEEKLIH